MFGVLSPPTRYVYCIFINRFSKIFKIWSFMSGNFFEKFSKICKNFPVILSTFLKSKKAIIFVTKVVQNDYIDQTLVKFSRKTPKNGQFFFNTLYLSKFLAPSAPKIWSFISRKVDCFGVRVPSL